MEKHLPLQFYVDTPDDEIHFYDSQLARVFITPSGQYGCGMCGHHFPDKDQAWQCVTEDTLKRKSFPVVTLTYHDSCLVTCLLCGRRYTRETQAATCLQRDLQTASLPIALSLHLYDLARHASLRRWQRRPRSLPARQTTPAETSKSSPSAAKASHNFAAASKATKNPVSLGLHPKAAVLAPSKPRPSESSTEDPETDQEMDVMVIGS